MTRLAVAWLVFRLSHSALILGVFSFAGQIPVLLLAPLAGPIVDRCDKRRLFAATQLLSMLQAFALAYLTFAQHVTMGYLIPLSVVRGCIGAFDLPTRQTVISGLATSSEHRSGVLALDSLVVNLCRLVGPSLAGLLLAKSGEGLCFLIDGMTYVASLAALLLIGGQSVESSSVDCPQRLTDSWMLLREDSQVRMALMLLCVTSLVALPFTVLLPIHVHDVLKLGPSVLGILGCASSAAAIAAAYLVSISMKLSSSNVCGYFGLIGSAIGLVGLASSERLLFSLLAVFAISFSIMLQISTANIFIQANAPERLRGTISTFYVAAFWGMVPIGGLAVGLSARLFGCRAALELNAFACVAVVALCNGGSASISGRPKLGNDSDLPGKRKRD
jgi:MFS family permease